MTIPGGFYEATFLFTGTGLPNGAACTIGGSHDGLQTPAQVAEDVRVAFAPNFMPYLASTVTLAAVRVKFGPDATGPSAEEAVGTVGGDATAAVSPQVAYLITKNTAVGGRRGKGRMYLPGVTEAKVDQSGQVLQTQVVSLQTATDAFLTALDTANLTAYLLPEPPMVWTLVNGQPRRVPSGAPTPDPIIIVDGTVSTRVATQRRRNRS